MPEQKPDLRLTQKTDPQTRRPGEPEKNLRSPLPPTPRPDRRENETGKAKSGSSSPSPAPARKALGMTGALLGAITRMDSAAKIRESLALAYWPRVVGEQAAAATQVESVRDGILFVRTKSSVWSHELTLHKTRLLVNLNRLLGGKIIQDIVFKAQGVDPVEAVVEPETPDAEELSTVILEEDEKRELRAQLQRLFTLKEDRIREAIACRITLEAKLRHWRLERGWHVCRRCHAVHKTDYPICPMCRLNG